jgi:hypothetical protein
VNKIQNVEIDSCASNGGQGKYMNLFAFLGLRTSITIFDKIKFWEGSLPTTPNHKLSKKKKKGLLDEIRSTDQYVVNKPYCINVCDKT